MNRTRLPQGHLARGNVSIHANPERMEQHIKALSAFGTNADGGVDRVAFSEADLPTITYAGT